MSRSYAGRIGRGSRAVVLLVVLVAAYVACVIAAPERTASATTEALGRIGTFIQSL